MPAVAEVKSNHYRSVRRSFLTLIEMLIVILVISLIAGLFTFNLVKAYRQQRFNAEVGMVLDNLRLAQDLMLVTPGDFYVKLTPKSGGFSLSIETDASLTAGWTNELKRSKKELKSIKYAKFEERLPTYNHSGEIDIKFFSNGSVMSEGLLRLAADVKGHGSLTSTICLSGFPAPVTGKFDVGAEIKCKKIEDEQYENNLTSHTVSEIRSMDELLKNTTATGDKGDSASKSDKAGKDEKSSQSGKEGKGSNEK